MRAFRQRQVPAAATAAALAAWLGGAAVVGGCMRDRPLAGKPAPSESEANARGDPCSLSEQVAEELEGAAEADASATITALTVVAEARAEPTRTGSSRAAEPEPLDVAPRADLPVGAVRQSSRHVSVADRSFSVAVVDVPLGSVRLRLGLARARVGATEPLADIARRNGAVAAINGCFFDAYSDRQVRNPYGTLISGGQFLHSSDHPTLLGYWADGTAAIGKAAFRLVGGLDGAEKWPSNWYAYGLNTYPESGNWVEIYTPLFALGRTPADGYHVVVQAGRVTSKGNGPQSIPGDGFVLFVRGKERYLAERFAPGQQCSYRVTVKWSSPDLDWSSAQEALGCGPLLVQGDAISVNPADEGFKDPKILTDAGDRSAVGLTRAGHLLLVTCPSATIEQLAAVMKALGCVEAMNLDGGASSGLWFRGKYLATPGRDISNALLAILR